MAGERGDGRRHRPTERIFIFTPLTLPLTYSAGSSFIVVVSADQTERQNAAHNKIIKEAFLSLRLARRLGR